MIANASSYVEELEKRVQALEAENKILKEKEFSLLRELPEIVFILDKNERCTFLNKTCIERFKLSSEDTFSQIHLRDLITPESLFQLHKLYLRNTYENYFHAKILKGVRTDGSTFPFAAYFSPIFQLDELTGFIGIGIDLTERIDIESKLKEANLTKMKFLSIIAHDLRNPFNSLVGFSTLLLSNFDRYSNEKIFEYIKHMSLAANQGYQLLENLLEWAKANTRKIDINPAPFNICTTINETIKLLLGNAAKKEIDITYREPSQQLVFADQNMIRTVVRNLLSNAIKFTHRNGSISIDVMPLNNDVCVMITDNGTGIESEKIPDLFTLRNECTTLGTEKERGTGLGLALCYEFVTLNKGTISATSILGQGSAFSFNIPIYNPLN